MREKIKLLGVERRLYLASPQALYLAVRRPEPIKFDTEDIFEPLAFRLVTEEAKLAADAVIDAAAMGKLVATALVDATFDTKLLETIAAVATQLLLPTELATTVAKRGKSS